jgi:hypothetical protein
VKDPTEDPDWQLAEIEAFMASDALQRSCEIIICHSSTMCRLRRCFSVLVLVDQQWQELCTSLRRHAKSSRGIGSVGLERVDVLAQLSNSHGCMMHTFLCTKNQHLHSSRKQLHEWVPYTKEFGRGHGDSVMLPSHLHPLWAGTPSDPCYTPSPSVT